MNSKRRRNTRIEMGVLSIAMLSWLIIGFDSFNDGDYGWVAVAVALVTLCGILLVQRLSYLRRLPN